MEKSHKHNIQTHVHSHTFAKWPIAWLNGHCPVITVYDNMSAALCSSVPLHPSPKPLTRRLLCNDHWNGSFCLTDTAIHSLDIMACQDHSSNSKDCRCGSRSQLMTSATGWEKCLVSLRPSVCQQNSGGHGLIWGTPWQQQCLQLWMRSFIHSFMH